MADLDPEEEEILRKHREKRAATRKQEDAEKRVWLRRGDTGDEIDLPYDKGRPWAQRIFGIDLDEEEVQDEPEEEAPAKKEPKGTGSKQGGQVRAFGRRVS